MLLARSSGGTHLSEAVEEPAWCAHLPVIHQQLRSHSSLSASDCGKRNERGHVGLAAQMEDKLRGYDCEGGAQHGQKELPSDCAEE